MEETVSNNALIRMSGKSIYAYIAYGATMEQNNDMGFFCKMILYDLFIV